jgi:hypothetical protein
MLKRKLYARKLSVIVRWEPSAMMEKARVISEVVNARQTGGLENIHFVCEYCFCLLYK